LVHSLVCRAILGRREERRRVAPPKADLIPVARLREASHGYGMGEQSLFGWLVFRRAVENTWALLRHKAFDGLVTVFSLTIGLPIFFKLYGIPGVTERGWEFLAFVFAPGGTFVLLVFLWYIFLAPTELIYESQKGNASRISKAVPAINWQIWRQVSEYKISEFAAIMTREDPISGIITDKQATYIRLLIQDASAKKLVYIPAFGTELVTYTKYQKEVDENTKIPRAEAIKWAETKGFDVSNIK
jgi:hypothetical protein